jgi:hypothetical protein
MASALGASAEVAVSVGRAIEGAETSAVEAAGVVEGFGVMGLGAVAILTRIIEQQP